MTSRTFDEINLNYAIKQNIVQQSRKLNFSHYKSVDFRYLCNFYENGQFINLASRYDANGIRAIASNKNSTLEASLKKCSVFT